MTGFSSKARHLHFALTRVYRRLEHSVEVNDSHIQPLSVLGFQAEKVALSLFIEFELYLQLVFICVHLSKMLNTGFESDELAHREGQNLEVVELCVQHKFVFATCIDDLAVVRVEIPPVVSLNEALSVVLRLETHPGLNMVLGAPLLATSLFTHIVLEVEVNSRFGFNASFERQITKELVPVLLCVGVLNVV